MAGFDITSVLKGVSNLDTEDQIVRISLDLIDPDPDNFYSLDGLDSLAGNIELIGLQQPLRVRPGEAGHFIVVSGHRRRAACLMIRDGGSAMFDQGVPCIVEYGEASDAMRKLRLIYANSATRVLTPAEISLQAEQVETLLYQLQEQGVVFPGRMRDHVAAACQKSKSKLARLHAIRSNLEPRLLAYFDRNEMAEDVAYQLSRFDAEIQRRIADRLFTGKQKKLPTGNVLRKVLENMRRYTSEISCPARAGQKCNYRYDHIVRAVFAPYEWETCDARCDRICCLDCVKRGYGCSHMCMAAKDRVKLDKAVEAEKKEKAAAAHKQDEEREQRQFRKEAKRLLALAETAGLNPNDKVGDYKGYTVTELRKIVSGEEKAYRYGLYPYAVSDAVAMARVLKISVSELLGEKVPKAESTTTLEYREGTPPAPGWYAIRMEFHEVVLETPRILWWDGTEWTMPNNTDRPIDRAYKVRRWLQLPMEGEG